MSVVNSPKTTPQHGRAVTAGGLFASGVKPGGQRSICAEVDAGFNASTEAVRDRPNKLDAVRKTLWPSQVVLFQELLSDAEGHAMAEEVRTEMLQGPAKRLRAILPSIVARAMGTRVGEDDALWLGLAVELLHCGTLCHDDVIDRDQVRRGRPSAWNRLGTEGAILLGDYLFFLAEQAVQRTSLEPQAKLNALEALGRSGRALALGQALETECCRTKTMPSRGEYTALARGKTGALFALAAEFAAVSEAASMRGTLRSLGEDFGLLFQLLDDYGEHAHSSSSDDCGDIWSGRVSWVASQCAEGLPVEHRRRFRESWYCPNKTPESEVVGWLRARISEQAAVLGAQQWASSLACELLSRARAIHPELAELFTGLLAICPGSQKIELERTTVHV